jgi:hypothetical protein
MKKIVISNRLIDVNCTHNSARNIGVSKITMY